MMSVAYCTIAVAMSGTVQPPAGSVNYNTMNIERSSFERTMGIFNALTSILFAYGKRHEPVKPVVFVFRLLLLAFVAINAMWQLATVQLSAGSVNYNTMAIERSSFECTMGIFNALTSILFAYGEFHKPLAVSLWLDGTWSMDFVWLCACIAVACLSCGRVRHCAAVSWQRQLQHDGH
jgi:hypothetical protein